MDTLSTLLLVKAVHEQALDASVHCRAAGGPKSLECTDIAGVLSARMFEWTISAEHGTANDSPFQVSDFNAVIEDASKV